MQRSTLKDESIGKKIAEARISKGFSRQQLAIRIDVTHQQLHKYESGQNRVSAVRLQQIAKSLQKPIMYFYSEEEAFIGENTTACLQFSRNFAKLPLELQSSINQLIRVHLGVVGAL